MTEGVDAKLLRSDPKRTLMSRAAAAVDVLVDLGANVGRKCLPGGDGRESAVRRGSQSTSAEVKSCKVTFSQLKNSDQSNMFHTLAT